MKKILLLSVMCISFTYSQQLSTDFSSYSTGISLEGQDSWTTNIASASQAIVSNAAPLSYSGYGSEGKYVSASTNSATLYFSKSFVSAITLPSACTFYYSMLVRVSSASSWTNCFFLNSNIGFFSRIWINDNGAGKWNIGLSKNSLSLVYGTSNLNYNQTYLVVVRYTFNPGSSDDEAYVWVNPSLTGEPNIATAEAVSGNGQGEYTTITECTGVVLYLKTGTPQWQLDDIRVGYGTTSFDAFSDLNYDGAMPVEVKEFSAISKMNGTLLTWNTSTEVNNHGFELQRSAIGQQSTDKSHKWDKVVFIEGRGTTNSPKEYSFMDHNLKAGKYAYRLKQIDRDGKYEYSQEVEVNISGVPLKFDLIQNFPNPFNPITTIGFSLQVSGPTTLKVFDMIGKHVATLVNEKLEAGVHYQRIFDGSKLSSGIYFAKLTSEGKSQTKKLILIK
jgi:hypothetical protein